MTAMSSDSGTATTKVKELFFGGEYAYAIGDEDLRPAEQALTSILELEQEAYNGGFLQYFQNSRGERAQLVVDMLHQIGSPKIAAMVGRMLELLAVHAPVGPTYVDFGALPKAVQDEINAAEREFYDAFDEINAALFAYVSKRREEIDAPDGFWTEGARQ